MESARLDREGPQSGIHVRMLGPLTIVRDGATLGLAASRKVRALIGYLALSANPVGRSRLCDLLWDIPNDPRGELRWCLSKIRSALDLADVRRVVTVGDAIALDLSDCFVDALAITAAAKHGIDTLDANRLRSLSRLFAGDFLEGLQMDRSAQIQSWLIAQRRRFRSLHGTVLEHLVKSLPPDCDEVVPHIEQWVALSPYDGRAHLSLLTALEQRGQIAECEEHLVTTARLFEAEDLDFSPVRQEWQRVRNRRTSASRARAAVPSPPACWSVIEPAVDPSAPRRASLAVMPLIEQADRRGGLADGLTHDVITRLAKLRSLFVIAQGSVFALAERKIGPEDAGRRLNVDYVASGAVRRQNGRIRVSVELVEARTSRIVWAEVYDQQFDKTFVVLDEIGDRIVASIASEIETVEKNHAILKPPNSLNAWEGYHRGLWHMYRFTREENRLAQHFFQMALDLDPTFARAYAGLSFTHWQNAFQRWADVDAERDRAFETAGQGLIVDDQDPAAHWAMGRALWLRGRENECFVELKRAVNLSPNFALGHYTLSFVHSQSGDPYSAIGSADYSRRLSPFDPLLFGMLAARAIAHVRLGQYAEAVEWALKAAARPNAHAHILAIAAHCLALVGRCEEGQAFAASIHKSRPGYRTDDFLEAFRFATETVALFRQTAKHVGLA